MKITERFNAPLPFVQFDIDTPKKLRVLTQQSGEVWFVYVTYPGEEAAVLAVDSFTGKDARENAIKAARAIANAFEVIHKCGFSLKGEIR
jgi:hypothetical protein